jgi:hypothetical protein
VKLFVDECFAKSIVSGLTGRGHDVVWAKDVCRGAEDYANRFDLSLDQTVTIICDQVDQLGETLVGYITVIEPGRVRRRPLPNTP